MHWINVRWQTDQLRGPESSFWDFRTKLSHFITLLCDFPFSPFQWRAIWALLSIIPLLYNSWDIIKYVSHTMDHSSKCKPFIGQCRIAYNMVIKTWRSGLWIRKYEGERESWSKWVMDHQGAVKANDELVCISLFFPLFSLFHPDTGKEMLFVFLRMCNFLLFILFESSCRILKPSNGGFKGLWRQLWLPAEASSWCWVATL